MATKARKGKEAVTQCRVIKKFKTANLAKVRMITGRTQQIRVHFASIGHPGLGDKTYGKETYIKFVLSDCMSSGQSLEEKQKNIESMANHLIK